MAEPVKNDRLRPTEPGWTFGGEILTYQMRILSDDSRGMTKGGILTEEIIRILQMEARISGLSRPSRALHLQNSPLVGRFGIYRGPRSWPRQGDEEHSLDHHPSAFTRIGFTRGNMGTAMGQGVCLSRRDLGDHVWGRSMNRSRARVLIYPPIFSR
jgi:hypothetical protein